MEEPEAMRMDPIVHFEIPVDDVERAKNFYAKLFGWQFEYYQGFDYYGVKAKKDGVGIDGGLMKRKNPGQPFTNYILVDDIDAKLKEIEESGGKVCLAKQDIGGMGWIAAFQDLDGNLLGLHQVAKKQ